MTAWLSGRRAAATVDRFMAAADPAELTTTFCPPGVTSPGEEDILRCYTYRAHRRVVPSTVASGGGGRRSIRLPACRVPAPDRARHLRVGHASRHRRRRGDESGRHAHRARGPPGGPRCGERGDHQHRRAGLRAARRRSPHRALAGDRRGGPRQRVQRARAHPRDRRDRSNTQRPLGHGERQQRVSRAGRGTGRVAFHRGSGLDGLHLYRRASPRRRQPRRTCSHPRRVPGPGVRHRLCVRAGRHRTGAGGLRVRRQGGLRVRGLGGRGRDHLRRAGGDPPGATGVGRSPRLPSHRAQQAAGRHRGGRARPRHRGPSRCPRCWR